MAGRQLLSASLRWAGVAAPRSATPALARTLVSSARAAQASDSQQQQQQQQQQQRARSEALNRTRSKIPMAKVKAAQASRAQLQPQLPGQQPAASGSGAPSQPQHQRQQQQQQQHAESTSPADDLARSAHARTKDDVELEELPEVIAYSTAQAYDFAQLARSGRLPQGWSLLEEGDVIHIPTWPAPPSSAAAASSAQEPSAAPSAASSSSTSFDKAAPLPGETFIFRSGAYVTWGLSENQARRFHRAVIRGRPTASTTAGSVAQRLKSSTTTHDRTSRGGASAAGGVEVAAYDQVGDEAMEYLISEAEPTRVVGDLIVLGRKPRLPSVAGSESGPSAGNDASASNASSPSSSSASPSSASPLREGMGMGMGMGLGGGASASDSPAYAPWSPLLARLSFSLGLARSARLTAQENSLDLFMLNPASPSASPSSSSSSPSSSTLPPNASNARQHPGSARIPLSEIPLELERTGRVPLKRKEVIKRMGKLLRLRLEANLDVEESFLDDNAFWENERLQHHYESICRALDIDRRFRSFNEKLDHVESLLSTIRALLTESSTHRMELIIIILIAIEVVNALLQHSSSQHQHQQHQQQNAQVQTPAEQGSSAPLSAVAS